jgi:hypothetical protein
MSVVKKQVLFMGFRCGVGEETSILEQQITLYVIFWSALYCRVQKCLFISGLQGVVPGLNINFNIIRRLDVRGFVHHNIIHKENPEIYNSVSKFISYLFEAQHVSGNTPPIIRSLKVH